MSSAEENEQKARNRGLPSIQEARDARAEGKTRWPSTKFWGYSALILAVSFILHWKRTDGEVEGGRQVTQRRFVTHPAPSEYWT